MRAVAARHLVLLLLLGLASTAGSSEQGFFSWLHGGSASADSSVNDSQNRETDKSSSFDISSSHPPPASFSEDVISTSPITAAASSSTPVSHPTSDFRIKEMRGKDEDDDEETEVATPLHFLTPATGSGSSTGSGPEAGGPRRAQAKASWDPRFDGYMDQRRPNVADKYIYQGPLFKLSAAKSPLTNLGWFSDVRAGFVPDFLCGNTRFVRYWKSCPQDITVMAYWGTGYMPYIAHYSDVELEAIELGGFQYSTFNSSDYFSCINNCSNGVAYQMQADVPYGYSRLCYIPNDDYAACPLQYSVCPVHATWNSLVATCECQNPFTYFNTSSKLCRCPIGKYENGTANACYDITCPRGNRLAGDDCVDACPYFSDYNYTDGRCTCRRDEGWISTPLNISGAAIHPWDMSCVPEPACPENYFWDDPIQCSCAQALAADGVCATPAECIVNGGTLGPNNKTCSWNSYPTLASDSLAASMEDWITYGLAENAGRSTYTYTLPSTPATGVKIRMVVTATAILVSTPNVTLTGADVPIRFLKSVYELDNTARSTSITFTPVNSPLVTGSYVITFHHTLSVTVGRDVRYSFAGANGTASIGSVSIELLDTSTPVFMITPSAWARNDAEGTAMELSTAVGQDVWYDISLGASWASASSYLTLNIIPSDSRILTIPKSLTFGADNVTVNQEVHVLWDPTKPPPVFDDLSFTIAHSATGIQEYADTAATVFGITTTARTPTLNRTALSADILVEGSNTSYSIILDGRAPKSTTVSVVIGYAIQGSVTPELAALIASKITIQPSLLSLGKAQLTVPQNITVSYGFDSTYSGAWSIAIVHTVTCTDVMFSHLTLDDIPLGFQDANTAGAVVSSSAITVTEGDVAIFTVSLVSRPLVSATLGFTITGPDNSFRNVSAISIAPSSWTSPRTVRVETIDNLFASGDRMLTISVAVLGFIPGDVMLALSTPDIAVTMFDDDVAKVGIVVVPKAYTAINATANTAYTETRGVQLTETRYADMALDLRGVVEYSTATWASNLQVSLATQPVQEVRVLVTADAQTQIALRSGRISPYALLQTRELIFTPTTWSIPQIVYVAAYDDDIDERRIGSPSSLLSSAAGNASTAAIQPHLGSFTLSIVTPTLLGDPQTYTRDDWPDIAYRNASHVIIPASINDNDVAGVEIAYDYMFYVVDAALGIYAFNDTWTVLNTSSLYRGVNVAEGSNNNIANGNTAPSSSLYFPARMVRPALSNVTSYAMRLTSRPYIPPTTASMWSTFNPRQPPAANVSFNIGNSFRMCSFSDGRLPEVITTCTKDSDCSSLRNLATGSSEVGVCTVGKRVFPDVTTVTFNTDIQWNEWFFIDVQAEDNQIDDTGSDSDFVPSQLSHQVVETLDPFYSSASAIVPVNIFDDDISNIQVFSNIDLVNPVSSLQIRLGEGASSSYAVKLTSQPRTSVIVSRADLGTVGNTATVFSPSVLTFSVSNWNIPQTFSFTAIQNYVDEGSNGTSFTILHEISSSTGDVFYKSLSRSRLPRVPVTIDNDDASGLRIVPMLADTSMTGTSPSIISYASWLPAGSLTHVLFSLTSQPTATIEVRVTALLDSVTTSLLTPSQDPGPSATIFNLADGSLASSYTSTLRETIRLSFTTATWSTPQPIGLVLPTTLIAGKSNVTLITSLRFPNAIEAAYSRLRMDNYTFSRNVITSGPAIRVYDGTNGKALRVEEGVTSSTALTLSTVTGTSTAGATTLYLFSPNGHCVVRGLPVPSLICSVDSDCPQDQLPATCLLNTKLSISPSTAISVDSVTGLGSFSITAFDDAYDEGSPHNALVLVLQGGATPTSPGASIVGSASILIADNDGAGIRTSPAMINITEGVATDGRSILLNNYTVVLRTPPTSNVTVTLTSSLATPLTSSSLLAFSPSSLVFTPTSYDTPQTVRVSATADNVFRGQQYFTPATHALSSMDPKYSGSALKSTDVVCSVTDIDKSEIVVEMQQVSIVTNGGLYGNETVTVTSFVSLNTSSTVLQINEGGLASAQPMIYLRLGSIPSTGTLLLRVSTSTGISIVSSASDDGTFVTSRDVIFDTTNWNSRVPIRLGVANDGVDRGLRTPLLRIAPVATTSNLANVEYATLAVAASIRVVDDDIASIALTPTSVTSLNLTEGDSRAFVLSITSVPAEGTTVVVTVDLSSSVGQLASRISLQLDSGGATLTPPFSLSWTPATANRTYTIAILAVDNADSDGNVEGSFIAGIATARTTDPMYLSKASLSSGIANIYLRVRDNDIQGIVTAVSGLDLIKGTQLATQAIAIKLGSRPLAGTIVTVTPSFSPSSPIVNALTFSPASVIFDSLSWNTFSEIRTTATSTRDFIPEIQNYTVVFTASAVNTTSNTTLTSAAGFPPWLSASVPIRALESVGAGFINASSVVFIGNTTPVIPTYLVPEGRQTTFSLVLTTQPASSVSYTARLVKGNGVQSDLQIVGSTSGSFDTNSWRTPIAVTVQFTEDSYAGIQESSFLCLAVTSGMRLYNARDYCINMTLVDNDVAGYEIIVSSGMGTTSTGGFQFVEGSPTVLQVKLTSVPRGTVSLTIASDNGALVPFSPAALTFPAGTTEAALTLVKVTDDAILNPARAGSFRVTATALNSVGGTEGAIDIAYTGITTPHLYSIIDDDAARARVLLTLPPEVLAANSLIPEATFVTATLSLSVGLSLGMSVPVQLLPSNSYGGIVTISPSFVSFNRSFPGPVQVRIGVTRDFILSELSTVRSCILNVSTTTGTVAAYEGSSAAVPFTVGEVDSAGWVVRPGRVAAVPGSVSLAPSIIFMAEGTFSTYALTLSSVPSAPVTVSVSYSRVTTPPDVGDSGLQVAVYSASRASLVLAGTFVNGSTTAVSVVFDKDNWSSGFVLNISSPRDVPVEGRVAYTVIHAINTAPTATTATEYLALPALNQAVSVTDSGLAVSASAFRLTEDIRWSSNVSYTLRLMIPPSGTVVVNIAVTMSNGDASTDSRVSVSPQTVTFSPTMTSAEVTVLVANDFVASPLTNLIIAHSSADDVVKVNLDVVDDDVPGLVAGNIGALSTAALSAIRVTEGAGAVNSFTVRLTSQPRSDVNISFTEVFPATATSPLLRAITNVTIRASDWSRAYNVTLNAIRDFRVITNRETTLVMTVISLDHDYVTSALILPRLTIAIVNVDVRGVQVLGTDRKTVIEGATGGATGAADSFSVRLSSKPEGAVFVSVRPGLRLTALPLLLQFTAETWDVAQALVVSAVDDVYAEDPVHTEVVNLFIDTVSTIDTAYTAVVLPSVTVSITDNDVATLALSASTLSVGESVSALGGPGVTTAVYTVSLASKPYFVYGDESTQVTATVNLVLFDGFCSDKLTDAPDHATQCRNDADCAGGKYCTKGRRITVSPATLSFTRNTWNSPQTVTVVAIQDDSLEPTRTFSKIGHVVTCEVDPRYSGVKGSDVAVTIWDDDVASIKVGYTNTNGLARVYVNEDATAATATGAFTLQLTSRPWAALRITPLFDADQVMLVPSVPSSIVVLPEDWASLIRITVGAVDDAIDEPKPHLSMAGFNITTLDPSYSSLSIPTTSTTNAIRVSIMDNDWAGVRYAFKARTSSGAMVRANSVSGGSAYTEDSCLRTCSSPTSPCPSTACTIYSGISTDLLTFEGGGGDSFSVRLDSRPSAPVTVQAFGIVADLQGEVVGDTCGDGRLGVRGAQQQLRLMNGSDVNIASLTFNSSNWNIPQTISVVAMDDRVDEGGDQKLSMGLWTVSDDKNYDGGTLRAASCAISQSISDANSHPGLALAYSSANVLSGLTPSIDRNGCPSIGIPRVSITVNENAWTIPPQITGATFSDDLTSIAVDFDSNTDFGGFPGSFNCSQLLAVTSGAPSTNLVCRGDATSAEVVSTEALLGRGAMCTWLSSRRLSVAFGASPTVVPGDVFNILGQHVRRGSVSRLYTSGNVTVTASASALAPSADIGPPSVRVGTCVGVIVSVSQAGSGNRLMTHAWSIVSVANNAGVDVTATNVQDYANVTSLLQSATTDGSSILTLGPDDWPQGWTVKLRVIATNFVGLSGTATVSLEKAATPVPVLILPSTISFLRSETVLVEARSFAPRCPGAPELNATQRSMTFYWFDTTNVGGTAELETTDTSLFESGPLLQSSVAFPVPASKIPVNNTRSRVLTLPARTLATTQPYRFTVFAVMDTDGTAYATSTVIVNIVADALQPLIVGGALSQRAITSAFTLDASTSTDPSGLASPDTTSYSWSCKLNLDKTKSATPTTSTSCGSSVDISGLSSPTVQIPSRALNAGSFYDFTVKYQVGETGDREASFTQTVQAVAILGPVFEIIAPTTIFGRVPPTSRLTLSARFGPSDDPTKLNMVWQQLSGPSLPPDAFLDDTVRPLYFATPVDRDSLVILPNILNPSAEYTFCLTAALAPTATNLNPTASTACSSFITAPVPMGGRFQVTAVAGGTAFTAFRFAVSEMGGVVDSFDYSYVTESQLPIANGVRDGYALKTPAFKNWVTTNGRTVGKRFDRRAPNDMVFDRSVLPSGNLIVLLSPTTKYTTFGLLWVNVQVGDFVGTVDQLLLAVSNAAGDGDSMQTGSSVAASASVANNVGNRRRLLAMTQQKAEFPSLLAGISSWFSSSSSSPSSPSSDQEEGSAELVLPTPQYPPAVRRLPPTLFKGRVLAGDGSTSTGSGVSASAAATLLKLAKTALTQASSALTPQILVDQVSILRAISVLPDDAMDENNTAACIDLVYALLDAASTAGFAMPLDGLTAAVGIVADCASASNSDAALAALRAHISTQLVAGASSALADGKAFTGQFAKSTLAALNTLQVRVGSDMSANFGTGGSGTISFLGASQPQDAVTLQILCLTDTPPNAELISSLSTQQAATFVAPPVEATVLVSSTNLNADPQPIPHPISGEVLPVLRMTYILDGPCLDTSQGVFYDARYLDESGHEWIRNGTTAVATTINLATPSSSGATHACQASIYTYHLSQFALIATPSSRVLVKNTNTGSFLSPLSPSVVVDEDPASTFASIPLAITLESAPQYPVTVSITTPGGLCYNTVTGDFVWQGTGASRSRITCDPVETPCATGSCFQMLAAVSPSTVVFSPNKWSTAITVRVTAPQEGYFEGSLNAALGVASSLQFTPSSADDRYDVRGACLEADSLGVCTLRSSNPGLTIPLSVRDADTPGIIVTGVSTLAAQPVNESDSNPRSYSMRLASKPFSSVSMEYSSTDVAAIEVVGSRLVFSPVDYSIPQSIVFAAVDDAIAQTTHFASIIHSITTKDSAYRPLSIPDVTITLIDDDEATISVSPLSKSIIEEQGSSGPASFLISVSSRPAKPVRIQLNATVLSKGVVTTPFRFVVDGAVTTAVVFNENNWETSVIVLVVGTRDGAKTGDVNVALSLFVNTTDLSYSSIRLSPKYDMSFTVTDADNARWSIRQGVPIISAGGSATYSIRLNSAPMSALKLTPVVINPNVLAPYPQPLIVSPPSIEFDAATYDQWQIITVTSVATDVAFPNKTFTVTHTIVTTDTLYSGLDPPSVSFQLSQAVIPLILIRPSRMNITEGIISSASIGQSYTNAGNSISASITVTLLSQPVKTNTLFFSFAKTEMYGPITLPGATSLISPYITLDASTYNAGVPSFLTIANDCIAWPSGAYIGTVTVVNGDPNYVGTTSPFTIQYTDDDTDKVGIIVSTTASPVQVPVYSSSTGLMLDVQLLSQPSAPVSISITSGNNRVRVANTTVVFYPSEFGCTNGVLTVSPIKKIYLYQSFPSYDANNAPIARGSGNTMITLIATGGGDQFYRGQSASIGVGFAGDPAASHSPTPTSTSTPSNTKSATVTPTTTVSASKGASPSHTPTNSRTPSNTPTPVSPTSTATWGSSPSASTVPARSLLAIALDGVDAALLAASLPLQIAFKTSFISVLPLVRMPVDNLQVTDIKRIDEVVGAAPAVRLLSGSVNGTSSPPVDGAVIYMTVFFGTLGGAKDLYADVGSATFADDLTAMLKQMDAEQGLGGVFFNVFVRIIGNAILVEPPDAPVYGPPTESGDSALGTGATAAVVVSILAVAILGAYWVRSVRAADEAHRREKLRDLPKFVEQGSQSGGVGTSTADLLDHQELLTGEMIGDGHGKAMTHIRSSNAPHLSSSSSSSPSPPSSPYVAGRSTSNGSISPSSARRLFGAGGAAVSGGNRRSVRSLSSVGKIVSARTLYGEEDGAEYEPVVGGGGEGDVGGGAFSRRALSADARAPSASGTKSPIEDELRQQQAQSPAEDNMIGSGPMGGRLLSVAAYREDSRSPMRGGHMHSASSSSSSSSSRRQLPSVGTIHTSSKGSSNAATALMLAGGVPAAAAIALTRQKRDHELQKQEQRWALGVTDAEEALFAEDEEGRLEFHAPSGPPRPPVRVTTNGTHGARARILTSVPFTSSVPHSVVGGTSASSIHDSHPSHHHHPANSSPPKPAITTTSPAAAATTVASPSVPHKRGGRMSSVPSTNASRRDSDGFTRGENVSSSPARREAETQQQIHQLSTDAKKAGSVNISGVLVHLPSRTAPGTLPLLSVQAITLPPDVEGNSRTSDQSNPIIQQQKGINNNHASLTTSQSVVRATEMLLRSPSASGIAAKPALSSPIGGYEHLAGSTSASVPPHLRKTPSAAPVPSTRVKLSASASATIAAISRRATPAAASSLSSAAALPATTVPSLTAPESGSSVNNRRASRVLSTPVRTSPFASESSPASGGVPLSPPTSSSASQQRKGSMFDSSIITSLFAPFNRSTVATTTSTSRDSDAVESNSGRAISPVNDTASNTKAEEAASHQQLRKNSLVQYRSAVPGALARRSRSRATSQSAPADVTDEKPRALVAPPAPPATMTTSRSSIASSARQQPAYFDVDEAESYSGPASTAVSSTTTGSATATTTSSNTNSNRNPSRTKDRVGPKRLV